MLTKSETSRTKASISMWQDCHEVSLQHNELESACILRPQVVEEKVFTVSSSLAHGEVNGDLDHIPGSVRSSLLMLALSVAGSERDVLQGLRGMCCRLS